MKVKNNMVNFRVKENIFLKMMMYMRANLKRTNFMVRENTSNKTDNNFMKVSLKTIRKTVKVFIITQIVQCIKVNGKMISNMEKANIKMLKMMFMKVKSC